MRLISAEKLASTFINVQEYLFHKSTQNKTYCFAYNLTHTLKYSRVHISLDTTFFKIH